MRDVRIYQLAASPWAIEERKGGILLSVLEAHSLGFDRVRAKDAIEEREARSAARAQAAAPAGTIAVLPIHGVMMPRGDFLSDGSGSISLEGARRLFRQMLSDSSIDGILLDIDSPGGSVYGVEEFAGEIRRAAKPVVAQAWDMAASAAYWIASAADELVVTPSGVVGSIGVYEVHFDASGALEKAGLKPTIIQAGKYKTELASTGPLSEAAQAFEQGQVDAYYTRFVQGVAAGRKTTAETVIARYGEGRVLMSDAALAAGMVDRIGTFEETADRFARDLSQKRFTALASEDARRRNARAQARLKASGF